MSLEIKQRQRESVYILDLNGRLVAGDEATTLRERIREMAAQSCTMVVLNLQDVDYIDSTGLGALVMSSTTLRKVGGVVKLLNLSRRNVELIVLTKLETVFEVFADEQDAVNSFFPDRKVTRFDILSFVQQSQKT